MNDLPNTESPSPPATDRTIVLIGMMGAGKTTVGRRLAAKLGLEFVDADSEIEAAAGCSIEDIFERHGEQAFRDGERRVIKRLLDGPARVLATGGGAFMDPETRARIHEHGLSVWLRADLDVLLERCLRRTHRPLLQRGDPRQTLERLIAQRYPVYAEADITVESGPGPHDAVVDEIVKQLQTRTQTSHKKAQPR
jgi:shikimate kinase